MSGVGASERELDFVSDERAERFSSLGAADVTPDKSKVRQSLMSSGIWNPERDPFSAHGVSPVRNSYFRNPTEEEFRSPLFFPTEGREGIGNSADSSKMRYLGLDCCLALCRAFCLSLYVCRFCTVVPCQGVACHCIHQLGNDAPMGGTCQVSRCQIVPGFWFLRPDEVFCGFQFSV